MTINKTTVLPAGWEMKRLDQVWIVGQRSDVVGETKQWTFGGVFSSRDKAIAACRDWTYFVGACTIDEAAPHEVSTDWLRDAHYPKGNDRPIEFDDYKDTNHQ